MSYSTFVRPFNGRLMSKLKLDKYFHSGHGNTLHSNDEGDEIVVVDFVSGYGSLLLGHNNKAIIREAIDFLSKNRPIHSQLSDKKYPTLLAQALNDEIEHEIGCRFISTYANTGTEAVEAALKHAKVTYKKKVKALRDRLNQQLHQINNHFAKESLSFKAEIDGQSFNKFEAFKIFCLLNFDEKIDRIIPFTIALEKAFHGKSSGALDLTYNGNFRSDYQLNQFDKKKTKFIKPDIEGLEKAFQDSEVTFQLPRLNYKSEIEFQTVKFCTCIGLIVEPLQGEGGINELPVEFLIACRKKTSAKKIPLIFDEIQCGFFRTGKLFHSLHAKVYGDYYVLAKSLGGGVAKNAVLLVREDLYDQDFGHNHTSTFAEDELSCAISLAAFKETKRLLPNKESINNYLFKGLNFVKQEYPEVIEEIKGSHLMAGIKFFDFDFCKNYSFQMISRSGYLNYFLASYLLNNHKVRLAPTLSEKTILRIQPSLVTTKEEIDQLIQGLMAVCQILHYRDFYKFIEFLLPKEERGKRALKDFGREKVPYTLDTKLPRIAFLTHYINENGARAGDESTEHLSDNTINQLLADVIDIATPIISGNTIVESENGTKVNLHFIGVLFTANMVRKTLLENNTLQYEAMCEDAITFANEDFGCSLIGLGQYSSVITRNGKTLSNPNINITTGNSFTVSIGIDAVKTEIDHKIQNGEKIKLALLGGGGNIISVYTKCMLPYSSELLIKGSDSESGKTKTHRFAKELLGYVFEKIKSDSDTISNNLKKKIVGSKTYQAFINGDLNTTSTELWTQFNEEFKGEAPIRVIDSLDQLKDCDVTVVATNSAEPFLTPEYFSPGSVVYDISVPVNCSQELIRNKKGIKVILGGIVKLPNGESFPMKGYPLEKGESFACISETILLGLENFNGNFSFGNLSPRQIDQIKEIGEKHNFKFLKPKVEEIF